MNTEPNLNLKLQQFNTNKLFLKITFGINIVIATMLMLVVTNISKVKAGIESLDELLEGIEDKANAVSSILTMSYFLIFLSLLSIALIVLNNQKEKAEYLKINILGYLGTNALVLLFLMFNIGKLKAANKLFKGFESGNMYSLFSNADKVDSIPNLNVITVFAVILILIIIAVSILNYFALFKNTNLVENINVKDSLKNIDLSKIMGIVKNLNMKIVIPIALGVIVLVGGLSYVFVFHKKSVDIMSNVSIKYEGISGKAYASIEKDIKKTDDVELNKFLNTVNYSLDKKSKLANGDTVTVTADYDVELAKKYKIKVNEIKKEFKIEGLNTIVNEKGKLSNTILEDIKTKFQSEAEKSIYGAKSVKHLGTETFYKVSKDYDGNDVMGVIFMYKLDVEEKRWFSEEIDKYVTYVIAGAKNIQLDKNGALVDYDKDNQGISVYGDNKDYEAMVEKIEKQKFEKLE